MIIEEEDDSSSVSLIISEEERGLTLFGFPRSFIASISIGLALVMVVVVVVIITLFTATASSPQSPALLHSDDSKCAPGQTTRKCSSFEGLHGGIQLIPPGNPLTTVPCYCPEYGASGPQQFTFVLTKNVINNTIVPGQMRTIVQVNGSVPGPMINVTEYDWVEVTVINNIPDEPTTIHWHGMIQYNTPFSDGVHMLTQCTILPGEQYVYKFRASLSGTFWWHSHHSIQYPNGVYGGLVINRLSASGQTETQYYGYSTDNLMLIQDFYNNNCEDLLNEYYLTPESGGNEPIPDAIVVAGKFSASLPNITDDNIFHMVASRTTKARFRFVGANALSMFNVSIDGVRMFVIEIDGTTVTPTPVSYFLVNSAQRVSVVVDWSTVPSNIQSVYIRVTALFSKYSVNITGYVPDYDVPGAVPLDPYWLGIVQFSNGPIVYPNYDGVLEGPSAPPPSDSNLLSALPVDTSYAPDATHYMYTEMDFFTPTENMQGTPNGVVLLANVNYASFNNLSSNPMNIIPTLFSFVQNLVPYGSEFNISSAALSQLPPPPNLESIYFNDNAQYLQPYGAVIDQVIYNTDNGEHPVHKHSYPFWVVATSVWPEAEIINRNNYPRRDVVTVPCCNGWAKIRYIVDVPGVWAQHCHIDWHLAAGLFATIVAAPEVLNSTQVPYHSLELCSVHLNNTMKMP